MNEAVYKAILQATFLKVMWENTRNLSHPPDENFLLKHWWPILPCRGWRACTTSGYPDGGDKCSGKLFQLMLFNYDVGENSCHLCWLLQFSDPSVNDPQSPLDFKEIKPVNPEGNQPWIFIGRTDAEITILWLPDAKNLIHWKRLWCWGRLRAGEGDDRGWDGWLVSLTQWTRVWASSRSWWWTGRPGVLWSMGSQRVGHDWVTELNLFQVWGNSGDFFLLGMWQMENLEF